MNNQTDKNNNGGEEESDLENSEEEGSEYLDATEDGEEDEREGDDDKRFTLNVDTLTGSHFQVFAYPSDTVDVVKARIAFQEGIGPYDQHLIWNNTELRDEKILSDIGLCDGCTVKLVLALKGGPLETTQRRSYIGNYLEEMISSLDNLFLNSTLPPLSPCKQGKPSVKLPRLQKQNPLFSSKDEEFFEDLDYTSDSAESGILSEKSIRDPKSKFVILEEQGRIYLIRLRRVDPPEDSDNSPVKTGSSEDGNRYVCSSSSGNSNSSRSRAPLTLVPVEKLLVSRSSGRTIRNRERNLVSHPTTLTTVNERIQENATTMEKVNFLKKRMLSARKKRDGFSDAGLQKSRISGKTKNNENSLPQEKSNSGAKNCKSSEILRLPQLQKDPVSGKSLRSGRNVAFGSGTTLRKLPSQNNLVSVTNSSSRNPLGTATSNTPAKNQRNPLSTTVNTEVKSSRHSTPLRTPSKISAVSLESHLYSLNKVVAEIFMQNKRNAAWKNSVGTAPYSSFQLAQYVKAKVNVLLCQQDQFYKNFPTVNEYRKTIGSSLSQSHSPKSASRSNNLLIPTVIFHRLFESDSKGGEGNKERSPQSKSGRVTARMKIKSVRAIKADTNVIPLLELNKNQSRPSTSYRPKSSRSRPLTGSNQTIKKQAKNHVRCASLDCKKKLGLATSYQCRCGLTFCPKHRYPETHSCSFDFKEEGRRIISHDNPLVGPKKIDDI